METEPIHDDRLTKDMIRIRSGATQKFYTPANYKDSWHNKPDVKITPPHRHWYAELVGENWYWTNGCGPCNGKPRGWDTYIECDKHNVCRTCGIKRADLKEAPWGRSNGWQCKACAEREHELRKGEALAKMGPYDPWDFKFLDRLTCPYCKAGFEDEHEYIPNGYGESEVECYQCDNKFSFEAEPYIKWSMSRLEDVQAGNDF